MPKIERSNYKRLIGFWNTEGTVFSNIGNLKLIGMDSYEFILDGNYILHKADVKMGNEKSETLEIISVDSAIEKGKMQYYNSKGESGVMTSSLSENSLKINGENLKFEGTITGDNSNLFGKWFLQTENHEWIEFIDLKLTKQH